MNTDSDLTPHRLWRPRGARTDFVVVIPHLGAGGAQRVASLLLSHWCSRGIRIRVLTLYEKPDAYQLHPSVVRVPFIPKAKPKWESGPRAKLALKLKDVLLGVQRRLPPRLRPLLGRLLPMYALDRGAQRLRWLRGQLRSSRARVVISFIGSTNIQTLIAARGLGLRVLISERNDPAIEDLGEPWEGLRRQVYREADLVTANSVGALATMRGYVPEQKLRLVVNPLLLPPCPPECPRYGRRLLFAGRLVHQKAPEILLQAFAQVADTFPGWHLDIVGDGPLRESLEQQADRLGIAGRTTFHGYCTDPYPLFYRAAMFALPSRFEGMPNAMLEAMGCGLAIIVSDASPGPLQEIRDGETGLVVKTDDVGALAAAIRRLMQDEPLRRRLGAAAAEQARRMELRQVAEVWLDLIAELGVELLPRAAADQTKAPRAMAASDG